MTDGWAPRTGPHAGATLTITAPAVHTPTGVISPGAVTVEGGRIVRVGESPHAASGDLLELPRGILSPGLVDLQVNGGFGVDLLQASLGEWRALRRALPATGVTSFAPTFVSAPLAVLKAAAANAALAGTDPTAGARILGIHAEGPFINPARAGAHDHKYLMLPTDCNLRALREAVGPRLLIVTLAPELPGAISAIDQLTRSSVVASVGHTQATATETAAAFDAGARMVTHLFNAQRGLTQREPGVPGAALTDRRAFCGLIVDLRHVAASVCQLAFQASPARIFLVTDAVASAGMPAGEYTLAGRAIGCKPQEPPTLSDGTLAGSSLTMDMALRNTVALGVPLERAIAAATQVPADAIGRPDLGRIAPGATADLVWWDDELQPMQTWHSGATPTACPHK